MGTFLNSAFQASLKNWARSWTVLYCSDIIKNLGTFLNSLTLFKHYLKFWYILEESYIVQALPLTGYGRGHWNSLEGRRLSIAGLKHPYSICNGPSYCKLIPSSKETCKVINGHTFKTVSNDKMQCNINNIKIIEYNYKLWLKSLIQFNIGNMCMKAA